MKLLWYYKGVWRAWLSGKGIYYSNKFVIAWRMFAKGKFGPVYLETYERWKRIRKTKRIWKR